jgi:hypothetical protein
MYQIQMLRKSKMQYSMQVLANIRIMISAAGKQMAYHPSFCNGSPYIAHRHWLPEDRNCYKIKAQYLLEILCLD